MRRSPHGQDGRRKYDGKASYLWRKYTNMRCTHSRKSVYLREAYSMAQKRLSIEKRTH